MALHPLNPLASGIKNAFRTKNIIATGEYSSIGAVSGQNYLGLYADINIIGQSANQNIIGQNANYNDFGSFGKNNYFGVLNSYTTGINGDNLNHFGTQSDVNIFGENSTLNLFGRDTANAGFFVENQFGLSGFNYFGQEAFVNVFGNNASQNIYRGGNLTNQVFTGPIQMVGTVYLNSLPIVQGCPTLIGINTSVKSDQQSSIIANQYNTGNDLGFINIPTGKWIFELNEYYTGSTPAKSFISGFNINYAPVGTITIANPASLAANDIALDNYISKTTGTFISTSNYSSITRKGVLTVTNTNSLFQLCFAPTTAASVYLVEGSYLRLEKLLF